MDCEKFESLLIDELYGELDEVTSAAVRRHAAGCARCGALLSGLRATRKVAALPMEEPSVDLEDRILSAVREQQKVLPFRARASSVLSRAGAWAMRPQTAMAAVFLLVIGTSFVLVQTRKQVSTAASNAEGTPMQAGAPVAATAAAAASAYAFDQKESAFAHGVEEKRADLPKALAAPSTVTAETAADDRDKAKDELAKNDSMNGVANAAPIAGAADLSTRAADGQGMQPGRSGGGGGSAAPYGNAPTQQAQHASTGAASQVQVLKQQACSPAVASQFDQLRTPEGTLEAARCYRALGNSALARQRYASLQSSPYAVTAQQELDSMAPAAARKSTPARPAEIQVHAAPQATTTAQAAPQAKPADQKASSSY